MASFPVRRNTPSPLASSTSGGDGGDDGTVRYNNSSASSSSSTSSSDYEYLNLFHKFDHLKRSPLAGLYNVVVHNTSAANATVAPPAITVSLPQEPTRNPPLSSPSPPPPPPPPQPQPRPIQTPSSACPSPVQVIGKEIRQETMTLVAATQRPYVEITEQPHPKALRFRYECEGRSAGSIPGINSTNDHKTYPAIQIHGYRGRAVVVVSCVTKGEPNESPEEAKYKPHPHNLVGKEGCKKGVCTVEINCNTMAYQFNNLGIQCVKKKDVEEALRLRHEIRVDPFRTGFAHAKEPGSIDLNAVRLCFQVFLEGPTKGRFTEPLTPVVSDIIYDKKAMSDLIICRLSDCSAPVSGGKEIILLCEKVVKEDIRVRFFEKKGNITVWQGYGEFTHTDVHKQVAISFRTPPYRAMDVTDPVKVYVQLERPSDNAQSDARDFLFTPLDSELRRKQPKLGSSAFMQVPRTQQQVHKIPNPASIPNLSQLDASGSPATGSGLPRGIYNYGNNNPFQQMPKEEIKNEPGDSPSHVPSNQYQLQPGQGLLNPQRISPALDRSPSTMTPSPGIAGSMSPHDQGSITPTPPYNNMSNAPMNPFANFGNFGTTLVTNQPQQQQQQQHLPPQTIAPIFDTNLPGPSNGWVQPIPTTSGNGLNPPQSFNLGNFGSISFSSDPMLGIGSLISSNNQMNVGPPSMGSDLMNLDLGNLPSNFNSAELRSVLDGLSTTEMNRLEQIAGQVANNQATGNAQQQSSTSQQQALKAFLATQQQQPPLPGALEPLPDRHDNDEDLTDSFKNLSTNDLN